MASSCIRHGQLDIPTFAFGFDIVNIITLYIHCPPPKEEEDLVIGFMHLQVCFHIIHTSVSDMARE